MRAFILSTIFILCISFSLVAQENEDWYERDSREALNRSPRLNNFKIGYLNALVGSFPVYYERSFGKFAVQFGAGVTFPRLLNSSLFEGFIKFDEQYEFTDGLISKEETVNFDDLDEFKEKIGLYFSLEPRYYLGNDGLDGAFLGLKFTNRTFNLKMDDFMGLDLYNEDAKDKFLSAGLVFGYQVMFHEYSISQFIGLGFNRVHKERYGYGYENFGSSEIPEGMIIFNSTNLFIEYGVRQGLGF